MKRISFIFLVIVILLAGCATVKIDNQVDFSESLYIVEK